MADLTEITVFYDEAGSMVVVLASAEKRIRKMLSKGESVDGEPGVIAVTLGGNKDG